MTHVAPIRRTCRTCHETLPLTDFRRYHSSGGRMHRATQCGSCEAPAPRELLRNIDAANRVCGARAVLRVALIDRPALLPGAVRQALAILDGQTDWPPSTLSHRKGSA